MLDTTPLTYQPTTSTTTPTHVLYPIERMMRSDAVILFVTMMITCTLRGVARAFLPLTASTTRTSPRQFSKTLVPPRAILCLRMAKSLSSTAAAAAKGDQFWYANMDCWRPTVNDVERISWGKPARQKGTGSRGVPHRLNEEERFLFDQARRKGFLEVLGSGWRSQRRDAPLLNSYRSLCDARGQVVIMVQKQLTTSGGSALMSSKKDNGAKDSLLDRLVVDLSPLRAPETYSEIAAVCLEQQEGGEIISGKSNTSRTSEMDENENENASENGSLKPISEATTSSKPWETRPIYHIDPYYIVWELPRADAKALGKKLAKLFDTAEGSRRAPSKKPIGIKPGKSRQHGGYGIG